MYYALDIQTRSIFQGMGVMAAPWALRYRLGGIGLFYTRKNKYPIMSCECSSENTEL